MGILAAFMVPHPPMIVPAVGRGSEKQVETTIQAYEQVAREIAALKPDTIVITSPHALMYADYFHISPGNSAKGSFSDFRAGQVRFDVDYDVEMVELITRLAQAQDFPAGTLGERQKQLDHGTIVPLWFIQKEYTDFRLVRIGLSGLPLTDHYTLGKMVAEAANRLERRIVFVASGDLSHKLQNYGPYGFAPEGPVYDERIMDVCSRGAFGELFDFDETFCEKAAECGHRSFVIMAGALDGLAVNAVQLSHEDVTGVGYGICTFYPAGEDDSRHFLAQHLQEVRSALREKRDASDPYVRLARETVEQYVLEHKKPRVKDLTELPLEMLHQQAGAFVSIHEHGRLRGCIGTIAPVTENLAQEIIDNAVSAATRDPRFNPVTPDELEWLEISVDVLGEPEEISSRDELDVKQYGVIVSSGGRRGLLLPDLDGVDTVDQQVDIAMRKGGISPRDAYKLERFEVIRHE